TMPEPAILEFSHREVVTALLRMQNIHSGIWGLHIKFALKATNIGASTEDLVPTAIVPVLAVGIVKMDSLNNLACDAAVANPAPRAAKRVGAGKTAKADRKR